MYMGSANLTGAGMGFKKPEKRNFEMGIISEIPEDIDRVESLFNLIWEGEMCDECGIKKHCKLPIISSF